MMDYKRQTGFTIIELIIYIGVIGLVLTAVTVFGVDLIKSKNKTELLRETQENARYIMSRLSYDIRWSNRIIGLEEGEIIIETNEGEIKYYLDQGALLNQAVFVEKNGLISQLTSDAVNIDSLQFTKTTGSCEAVSVEIEVTGYPVSSRAENNVNFRLQTTASPRSCEQY